MKILPPKDCHRHAELDKWLYPTRVLIKTKKGTIKGYLQYQAGWYFCQAPELLVDGVWVNTNNRFLFRKGQFISIEKCDVENSLGR